MKDVHKKTATAALKKAIEIIGSQVKVAELCDVSPQAVYWWLNNGLPPCYAPILEFETKGEVTCLQLCPHMRKLWRALER